MMTSKEEIQTLCSLSFEVTSDYDKNLQTLLKLIKKAPKNALIVAPEVCLSGFDYENIEAAVSFASYAKEHIAKASAQKVVIFTLLEKKDDKIYNMAQLFYDGKLVHTRAKARLFSLGAEHQYMQEGSDKSFEIVKVAGLRVAILICFELRFTALWKLCEGADIICIPAWWGASRKKHFKILTEALAVMNQAYVVSSDVKNIECSNVHSIISPKGEALYGESGGNTACLEREYNKKDIALMRRYINVGLQ